MIFTKPKGENTILGEMTEAIIKAAADIKKTEVDPSRLRVADTKDNEGTR